MMALTKYYAKTAEHQNIVSILTRGVCVSIIHIHVCKSVFVCGLGATLLLLVINPIIMLGVAQAHLRHRGG